MAKTLHSEIYKRCISTAKKDAVKQTTATVGASVTVNQVGSRPPSTTAPVTIFHQHQECRKAIKESDTRLPPSSQCDLVPDNQMMQPPQQLEGEVRRIHPKGDLQLLLPREREGRPPAAITTDQGEVNEEPYANQSWQPLSPIMLDRLLA
ncbi:unnamed protein product [Miscanthus lutarioriparius]|uniref:Uncharacterized protein n=1 Tax=Miscanthus lutarioriparius TaxID=422564 RepID=A0A811Q0X2_9POAL|nr:unnamed protein product [Miscanthus lutarioriparius]